MIIDCHAHFDPRLLDLDAMIDKLDEARVDRVVLIPAMNDPLPKTPERLLALARTLSRRRWTRPLVERIHRAMLTPEGDLELAGQVVAIYARPDNAAVARACALHPERVFGWVFLNPRNNPFVLDELEQLRSQRNMVGVKLHPHWHDYRTALAHPLLERIQELKLPVLIHLGFGERGDYRTLCQKFPKIRFIAAHAGVPFYDDLWRHGRDLPNLFVDLSSPYIDEELARAAVKALGHRRCLYGTDAPYGFPLADHSYDYRRIRGWVEDMPLTSREREDVLGENARELLAM